MSGFHWSGVNSDLKLLNDPIIFVLVCPNKVICKYCSFAPSLCNRHCNWSKKKFIWRPKFDGNQFSFLCIFPTGCWCGGREGKKEEMTPFPARVTKKQWVIESKWGVGGGCQDGYQHKGHKTRDAGCRTRGHRRHTSKKDTEEMLLEMKTWHEVHGHYMETAQGHKTRGRQDTQDRIGVLWMPFFTSESLCCSCLLELAMTQFA